MFAQIPVQDAFPHIDGIYARRAVLKQTIRKPTCGSTHIGTHFAVHIQIESIKGRLQLIAAARDKARAVVNGQVHTRIHFVGRLAHYLIIGTYLTRHHQALR